MSEEFPSIDVRALLDAAVDGIIVIDRHARIEIFNHAAERLFGYVASEVIGHNVKILMPEGHRDAHDGYIERFLRTRVPHVIGIGREIEARRKDGSLFPAQLSIGHSEQDGHPKFVGFIHDISERKRAEADAHHVQERMLEVGRLATLGEMAAGIAHELNQPLSAITTYAHAGRRLLGAAEPDLAEMRGALDQIAGQGLRAGEIIRRLRNLVRGQPTAHEPASINGLVEELGPLLRVDARLRDIQLSMALDPALPPVRVDAVQIQQVLVNLVHNAIHALTDLPPQRRRIVIRTRRIDDETVEVAVLDAGPGVAPTIEQRMFEPFCTTRPDGTGLGLAISRTIAKAHGGTLGYAPNVPEGACFSLQLPTLASDPDAAGPASRSRSGT